MNQQNAAGIECETTKLKLEKTDQNCFWNKPSALVISVLLVSDERCCNQPAQLSTDERLLQGYKGPSFRILMRQHVPSQLISRVILSQSQTQGKRKV